MLAQRDMVVCGVGWSARLGWASGAGPGGALAGAVDVPGRRWGTGMISRVITAVRSDRDRWFGERVSPWWRAMAVRQPGAGVAEEKGGPANPR